MSSRATLLPYVKSVLDDTPGLEDVRMIPTIRATDRISKPILIVRMNRIEKLVAAPLRGVQATFTLVLVSPHNNMEKAEDQLDDLLEILLPALLTHKIRWDSAEQTQYDDEHLAYDITIQSILS